MPLGGDCGPTLQGAAGVDERDVLGRGVWVALADGDVVALGELEVQDARSESPSATTGSRFIE